ncbi:MAG: hypothetical protein QOK15_1874 [Nocardioidaceae bacterium]|nr:hypothetical protein [Nocardioidaceae bacterium]
MSYLGSGSSVRRVLALVVAALLTVLLPLALAGLPTATASSASASGHTRPIKQVKIHKRYLAQLPKQKNEKKAEFGPNETGGSGAMPLTYHGGPVQHSPKVYLLLWGPSWSTTGTDTAYLQNFFAGLGVQPQDDWSTSMSQYTDSTGHPTFNGSVYAGTFQDTSTPPTGATQTQFGAEADAFYHSQGITNNTDTQIVVATQDGTCPDNFYNACNGYSGSFCAYHSYSSTNRVPYTNLPYLFGQDGCGNNYLDGPSDGVSIVGGHEYGETVTDPRLNAWYDTDYSGENGDKCSWTGIDNVTLSTGTFAMQPLWSNSAGGCVMHTSTTASYSLNVSKSGTGAGTVTSSPSGINCGATCSANFAGGSSVALSATPASGSTFSGWSGPCSGTGSCTVSMTAAQSVTAAFSTATTATTSQETSPAITYNGWKGVTDASASGGAYRHSNTTGAKSAFKFTGTSVTWLSLKGPSRGIAKVTVDGVSKGTVDLYAASVGRFTKTFSGLSSAAHTIAVQVTGTKNATATGTWVAVDGFTVGSATTQESSRAVAFDSWAGAASTSASGGEYRVSGTAGATAAFTFTGSSVDWLTAVGPGWGKAEVYIDGTDKGTVDLYAATLHWQTTKTYSGLGTGSHTITIKALGTKNASANSTKVPVDAFVVR